MDQFLTQCPDAGFLYAEETGRLLASVKRLRNEVAHGKTSDPGTVREIVPHLWEDQFLGRYLNALVKPREPAKL